MPRTHKDNSNNAVTNLHADSTFWVPGLNSKNSSMRFAKDAKLLLSLMMFFSLFQAATSLSPTPTLSYKNGYSTGDAIGIGLGFGGALLVIGLSVAVCFWAADNCKCRPRTPEGYDEVPGDSQFIDDYQLPELNIVPNPL